MPAMSTALTEFSDNGNSRTYTLSGHTAMKPKIVVQKRKIPANQQASAEITVDVVLGTQDSEGMALSAKTAFSITARYPVLGQSAEITSGLAVIRDIVASDEFAAAVTSQNWLKP
jgi:hypothetical protein